MDGAGVEEVAPLDERDPGPLGQTALPLNQLRNEHAARRDHVGHAGAVRDAGGARRRPEEHGVSMHHLEVAHPGVKGPAHGRRVVKAAHCRSEVVHAHAVPLHRMAQRHVRDAVTINIRREDLDLMAPSHQGLAEAVDGEDRAAIACGRKVGGDDVEDTHEDVACYAMARCVNATCPSGVVAAARAWNEGVARRQPRKNAVSSVSCGSEYACADTRKPTILATMMAKRDTRSNCDESGSSPNLEILYRRVKSAAPRSTPAMSPGMPTSMASLPIPPSCQPTFVSCPRRWRTPCVAVPSPAPIIPNCSIVSTRPPSRRWKTSSCVTAVPLVYALDSSDCDIFVTTSPMSAPTRTNDTT